MTKIANIGCNCNSKITIANGEEQFPVVLVTSDAIPSLFCGHNLQLNFKLKLVFLFFFKFQQ